MDIVGVFGPLSLSVESDSLVFWVGMPGAALYLLFCHSRHLVVDIIRPIDGCGG